MQSLVLLVNLGKCQFIQESVIFLGQILSREGIRPESGKDQEILRFNVPETCSEVKSFLGMASFFPRFVPHFSEYAAPLFELLKKKRVFEWTDECERDFNFIISYKILEDSCTHSLIARVLFIAMHLVKPLCLCWHRCMMIC